MLIVFTISLIVGSVLNVLLVTFGMSTIKVNPPATPMDSITLTVMSDSPLSTVVTVNASEKVMFVAVSSLVGSGSVVEVPELSSPPTAGSSEPFVGSSEPFVGVVVVVVSVVLIQYEIEADFAFGRPTLVNTKPVGF